MVGMFYHIGGKGRMADGIKLKQWKCLGLNLKINFGYEVLEIALFGLKSES